MASCTVVLIKINISGNTAFLSFYHQNRHQTALLRNPDVLDGCMLTGTEIEINLFAGKDDAAFPEAELILNGDDFLPDEICGMLEKHPPTHTAFFGLISDPAEENGRYYMLRDLNKDGLLLCTGTYIIKNGKGICSRFDGQWHLRYNLVENFFYAFERPESEITEWKHPAVKLKKINENISIKNLNKRFRNRAAGWHRYNFFTSDDWSLKFYRRQARLGFIAITHFENGALRLTPQLQREYAVLDWQDLIIDRRVEKILSSGRIGNENIRLHINPDPAAVLKHLTEVWSYTWITEEYSKLITDLAAEIKTKNDKRFRVWGVTLTAGPEDNIIAGELGYSIGKTYTSLSGFFHRGEKLYNNFGKLQMVMLAGALRQAGIAFWNLGQPYMEYKIKLGAKVTPRGLFLKRWDKAVRGRTPDLSTQ